MDDNDSLRDCGSSSSDAESSKSDSETLDNDWQKFAWASENDNIEALIDLIESNESNVIPAHINIG